MVTVLLEQLITDDNDGPHGPPAYGAANNRPATAVELINVTDAPPSYEEAMAERERIVQRSDACNTDDAQK